MRVTFIIVSFLLSACFFTTQKKSELFKYSQTHMGAPFTIYVYSDNEDEVKIAVAAAYKKIKNLDSKLSDYKDDSEINLLSNSASHGCFVPVSEDLWKVMNYSQQIALLTDGAFDVSVGPYVVMWRMARYQKKMPDKDKLKTLSTRVGYKKITLDKKDKAVKFQISGMKLDFGGIAKGYAADMALKELVSRGYPYVLVDAGGDMVATTQPQGRPWPVRISSLPPNSKRMFIKNQAIATSGDRSRFLKMDGVVYSHIVNPLTGIGVTGRYQVTVIAEEGMKADTLASTFTVMGPKKGMKLVETMENTEVMYFQLHTGLTFKSSGWSVGCD